MMHRCFFAILIFLAGGLRGAETITVMATGDAFPPLRGEFLTGKKAVLPEAAEGHIALIAMGFTYESRFAVEKWTARFREDYGSNPQVTFFEVPMIGGPARLGKWFIDSGMRRGTASEDREHVITSYEAIGEWKQRMNYANPNAAYLILLDRKGVVRWLHNGFLQKGMQIDRKTYGMLSRQTAALLAAQVH